MGERLPYKQRVGGSSPSASTMNKRETDSNLLNKAEPFFYNISLRATRTYPFRWRILFFIHDTNDAHIDRMSIRSDNDCNGCIHAELVPADTQAVL